MTILQIISPPSNYLNVFRGEDGLAYTEPVLALALIKEGARQSIEAVATIDGGMEVLHPDTHEHFLGTYYAGDPALERLRAALQKSVDKET